MLGIGILLGIGISLIKQFWKAGTWNHALESSQHMSEHQHLHTYCM